jgi:sarcosine oxidase subunit gamma
MESGSMIELRRLPAAARFILQGGGEARSVAGEVFGVPLPESACRANAAEDRAALWLGPDEHLLLGPAAERDRLAAGFEAALAGIAHSLVDVSQRQVAWRLSGKRAGELLNTGCPLDLDIAVFPPGMCTRTVLAKAQIILWRKAAEEYHLEIWRSYADYVRELLLEAARSDLGEAINEGDDHGQRSAG